jgi:manganese transport system substrate-binding protein
MRRSALRILALLAACAAAGLGAAGCGGGQESASASGDGRKVVLTSFTVLQDMARNVAGDKLRVESITKPGTEIHHYEPTPRDIGRAQEADLILDNGLDLELWFEKFLGQVDDVPHVTLTDGIRPMPIAGGAYRGRPNPHSWMSPANALVYVDHMRRAFTELDPANAAAYDANAKAYSAKLEAVGARLRAALAEVPAQRRWLVSCEGAFSYLARDFGLREGYLWAVNQDQQGTPKQVAGLIDAVRANRVPTVFCESTVSDKAQRQVAAATGARFGGLLYVDSLSGPDGPVPTYLDLLEHDTRQVAEGLRAGAAR